MGAWGAGAFDNDAAGDWTDRLHDEAGAEFVEDTLRQVTEAASIAEVDSDDCCAAVAAAEVVAASRGWPDRGLPDEVADWIYESGYGADEPVVRLALQAVQAVDGESQLAELMEQEKAWRRKMQQLVKRLSKPEKPKGRPKSPNLRLSAQAKAAIKQFKSAGAYIVAKEAYFDFAPAQNVQALLPQLAEFRQFEYLSFEGRNVTDDGLAVLKHVRRIDRLRFKNTTIGDESLASIAHLKGLKHLELEGTRITDAGFALLGELPELKYLSVNRTRLTDAAADKIAAFRALEDLWMDETAITDDAMPGLAGLPLLKVLSLAKTSITDTGLEPLRDARKLKTLILAGTGVTDAGIEFLGGVFGKPGTATAQGEPMDDYCVLRLEETAVSDEGLKHLQKCVRLKFVNLRNTRVTAAGAEALQAALPDAQILS